MELVAIQSCLLFSVEDIQYSGNCVNIFKFKFVKEIIVFELFSSIAECTYMDSHAKISKFISKVMQKLMNFFDNNENQISLTKEEQYHSLLQRQKNTKVITKYNLNVLADSS